MGVIVALVPDPVHLSRLRAAVRDRYQLVECDEWHKLEQVCERQAVRMAVFDLYRGGAANFDAVRQLRARFPGMTLVAYITFGADRAHDLFDAGRCGIDGVVIAGADDAPRALLALIDRAQARGAASLLARAVTGVDAAVRDAILVTVTRGHERLSPAALADILRLPRRALSQRLADAGYPPPHRLITWGRLILAAQMLDDGKRSIERVATALSFPSGSAFRNSCQRYLRATPGEIRARGGADYVVRALLRELEVPGRARGTRLLATGA
jgi:AraC-like DNA-binding protein